MLTLLRHGRVIDHQHRITAADELVSLDEKLCLQRSRVPHASSDEVVQPVIVTRRKPLGDGRNALAVTRTDQPRNIEGTHPPPCLMTQPRQKRRKTAPKLCLPIRARVLQGQPLDKPTTHELLKNRLENPGPHPRRKICKVN